MVLIFDSHPVQYKAPVYQWIEKLKPGAIQVVYATDCSLRGYRDREFGEVIAWDTPLLSGYSYKILNTERGVPLQGFSSLTGRGVYRLLKIERPRAVLLSQFLYEADLAAYLSCLWLGIPIWIRHETQDEAFSRTRWKSLMRGFIYRLIYHGISHAFYCGQLNREHLLRHGVAPERMSPSLYCAASRVGDMSDEAKTKLRETMRTELGVKPEESLVLFCGKLIEKKNPGLILRALQSMSANEADRFKIVLVGSGELEASLKEMAASLAGRVLFAGFVNQAGIAGYYLAADILVLPSRKAGETWGLVVNEALQAGCAVVVTDTVGCHREFGSWERVRVIPDGDADACTRAMEELSKFKRSFDWCETQIDHYSVRAAAQGIVRQIEKVEPGAVQ